MFYVLHHAAATSKAKRKRDEPTASNSGSPGKKKKDLTTERREERNLREKERSLKITQQIHELRNLLSSGGVIVPKVSSLVVVGASLCPYLPNFISTCNYHMFFSTGNQIHNPNRSGQLHPSPPTESVPIRNGSSPTHQRSPTHRQRCHW